jgi:hypothetical protein
MEATAPVHLLRRQPWPAASTVITAILSIGPVLPTRAAIGPAGAVAISLESGAGRSGNENRQPPGEVAQNPQPQNAARATGQPEELTLRGRIALPARTLRDLYNRSERIVVARVATSSIVERDGARRVWETALYVAKTLKGKHRDLIYVYESTFDSEDHGQFQADSNVLVFLKRRESSSRFARSKGWEAADYSRAVKVLPEPALEKYAERVAELDAIMQKPRRQPQEIVEWLVRCAEDPATRWEGVVDLVAQLPRGGSLVAGQGTDSSSTVSKPATSQDGEESAVLDDLIAMNAASGAALGPLNGIYGDRTLAAFLTARHKERLMDALTHVDELHQSDIDLINLVSRWDEPRLLPFLVAQLRRMEETAPQVAQSIINIVDEILADEAIGGLAEQYHDNASYEDLAQQEAADDESDAQEDPDDPEEGETMEMDVEPERPLRSPEEALAVRTAMLKRFIEAVEAKLARSKSM